MRPPREAMMDIAELSQKALAILNDKAADLRDVRGLLIQIRTISQLQAVRLRAEHFRDMPAASEVMQ